MLYRKLKRTNSYGYMNYIPHFKKVFPELKNITNDEMVRRFKELNLDFFTEKKTYAKKWVRLTLPFALILMLLMLSLLPIVFIIKGSWSYGFSSKNLILNWFRMLKLHK